MWSVADALNPSCWIEQEAFDRILADTIAVFSQRKKRPKVYSFDKDFPAVVRGKARRFLDHTIGVAMQAHFLQSYGLDAEELRRNAEGALRYFEEIDRLREFGFEQYETIGHDLLLQLHDLVSRRFDLGNIDPPHRSRHHWERVFFPDTMGLFYGLFGEAPTASVAAESKSHMNSDDAPLPSPAFEFVSELILEVDSSEAAIRLKEAARGHQVDLGDWGFGSENALRNKIAVWKKYPTDAPLERKRWRSIGQEFVRSFAQLKS